MNKRLIWTVLFCVTFCVTTTVLLLFLNSKKNDSGEINTAYHNVASSVYEGETSSQKIVEDFLNEMQKKIMEYYEHIDNPLASDTLPWLLQSEKNYDTYEEYLRNHVVDLPVQPTYGVALLKFQRRHAIKAAEQNRVQPPKWIQ